MDCKPHLNKCFTLERIRNREKKIEAVIPKVLARVSAIFHINVRQPKGF